MCDFSVFRKLLLKFCEDHFTNISSTSTGSSFMFLRLQTQNLNFLLSPQKKIKMRKWKSFALKANDTNERNPRKKIKNIFLLVKEEIVTYELERHSQMILVYTHYFKCLMSLVGKCFSVDHLISLDSVRFLEENIFRDKYAAKLKFEFEYVKKCDDKIQ